MKATLAFLSSLGRGIAVVLLLVLGAAAQAELTEGVDAGTRKRDAIESVDKALACYKKHRDGGERNEDDPTGKDYSSIATEWKAITVQTNATGDVTVWPGPALVKFIRVRNTTDAGVATTATAGIVLVKNGGTVVDGAAASKGPGSVIYDGADGAMFRTSLVLNFANAADNPSSSGKVEVLLRPLDPWNLW